ncbi:MAG: hypothetical protein ABI905_17500 [Betaproteobacteria bacterium]
MKTRKLSTPLISLVIVVMGLCAQQARAQALFTVNVPINYTDIPADFTKVSVICELSGKDPVTGTVGAAGMAGRPYAVSTPLVNGKAVTTVKVEFVANDLQEKYRNAPQNIVRADCRLFGIYSGNTAYIPYDDSTGKMAHRPGTKLVSTSTVNF